MMYDTNDIAPLLEKKIAACEDFLSATLLLKAALETEEMTTVDHLIGRRQELIRVIDEMDRRATPDRLAGPPDQRRRMVVLSEELKRVLQQILSANQVCEAITASRCEEFRNDLMNVRRREEGIHGYLHSKEKTPKFLNIRT
jgi:hypothetical protein